MEDVKCQTCGRAVHPYRDTEDGKCPVCRKEIEDIYSKVFPSIAPDEDSTIRGYHLRRFFEAGYKSGRKSLDKLDDPAKKES